MTLRESDSRIVPLPPEDQSGGEKASSIGAGKAAGISRDPDQALSVLSDGIYGDNQVEPQSCFCDGSSGTHAVELASRTPPRGAAQVDVASPSASVG